MRQAPAAHFPKRRRVAAGQSGNSARRPASRRRTLNIPSEFNRSEPEPARAALGSSAMHGGGVPGRFLPRWLLSRPGACSQCPYLVAARARSERRYRRDCARRDNCCGAIFAIRLREIAIWSIRGAAPWHSVAGQHELPVARAVVRPPEEAPATVISAWLRRRARLRRLRRRSTGALWLSDGSSS
jgi:hypothetical protein